MDAAHEPESFRSLLLRHRGRTGLIQRDLAARAGVSLRSVQDWEAGVTLPTTERLQALIRALLGAGGLTAGHEVAEAHQLWTAVERETPRIRASFDEEWLAGLIAARAAPTSAPAQGALRTAPAPEPLSGPGERDQDWGEAPDTTDFVGRAEELALLRGWVLDERCRLVALLGMGGIGKTSLAARLAQMTMPGFERVYWRSLRNAPPVSEWLAGAIGFLSDHHLVPPPSESEQISALLSLLRTRRCLLVLDNSETLLEAGQGEGRYRASMDGYGRLLQAVGETSHQSCLLLTSREAPPELAVLGSGVRSLELHGLGASEARALLTDKQLKGDTLAWVGLVERYGGNGLALKIVGETIRQVYDGDVAAFVEDAAASYGTVFGGIRRLLDTQAERLSPVERDVLTRLAIEREPISMAELSADMAPRAGRNTVIEAIENLRRRSLVERGERGATFTLQSMVLEYATNRLVETVSEEVRRGEPVTLVAHPIIKAQAKDYVRQAQERLIGGSVLQRLNTHVAQDPEAGAEHRLLVLLDGWRGRPSAEQGYGPGNVVNLLRLLRGDLRGMDFSHLALRQVYLQGVDAQDTSIVDAHLAEAVLAEAYVYPTGVALSADGAFLAVGTPTGEVRLWRAADRTLLLSAQAHIGLVPSVAFSGDGRLMASAGDDGLVHVWDTSTLQLVGTLQGHTGVVWGIALSSDGRVAATGSWDGTVRLWEARTGKLQATARGHDGPVWGVGLSSDARLVASGGDDGTVRLWDGATGQLLNTLRGHTGGVRGVALSGDGRLAASGSWDTTVRLWETDSGRLRTTLQGHVGLVMRVAFSENGRVVGSAGYDGTVRLWEADGGQLAATLVGHTGVVWGVALSRDGRLVASSSRDGTVRLWESDSHQLVADLEGDTGVIQSVALSSDGQLIASASFDGKVRLWAAGSGQLLATLLGHNGAAWCVALSGDGRLSASGGSDGTIRLWDTQRGHLVFTLTGHTGLVWSIAFSRDGRLVASGGVDGTVRLWDAQSGQFLGILERHTGVVYSVALSADGRLVASGGVDGTVRLSDAASGRLLATFDDHKGQVYGVALSDDGRLLASGGYDGAVRLRDAPSGKLLATLEGNTGIVSNVALSSDGRLLASSTFNGDVRQWDAASGKLLVSLRDHTHVASGVALSGDGRLLANGSADGVLKLWETASGACVRTLRNDRLYERLDITRMTGINAAQHAALLALGAIQQPGGTHGT